MTKGLWASKLEIACMQILDSPIRVSQNKGHMEDIGECGQHTPTLRLRKGHYVLAMMKYGNNKGRETMIRGGVRSNASRSRSATRRRATRSVSSTLPYEGEGEHMWHEDSYTGNDEGDIDEVGVSDCEDLGDCDDEDDEEEDGPQPGSPLSGWSELIFNNI